ncbi:MAG: tetratricopeptide repeat protein [Candidatus Latescibacteria bacterium]|nr:tetratricopeptide repeat protein [Candidatus Latescibacterota bacterium]NIO78550.1 tetratricopeptide repeat protein [Candidatus Latescibacterota bacterium]
MGQYERALAAMRSKREKQAERMLLAMTRSYPELAGPYVNLGIIYYRTGRLREAELAFKEAIEISPNRADVYNHLGIVLRENGRFSEAREVYEHALQLDPLYAYARLNLGILFDLYLLDADSALHHYELYQSLASSPDEDVAKWIVDLKRRMRRSQKTAVR